jgi:hypothetical protein
MGLGNLFAVMDKLTGDGCEDDLQTTDLPVTLTHRGDYFPAEAEGEIEKLDEMAVKQSPSQPRRVFR